MRLYSRNQLSFDAVYGRIARALARLQHEAVLDGEIGVLDEQGKANFQSLQNYQRGARGQLAYYVFDLLYPDGHDLRSQPLRRRKEALEKILPEEPALRLSEHVEEQGLAFFHAAARQGLEGIIAKEASSRYEQGRRSKQWLKIKTSMRQEAVIGGYTRGRGSRKGFGALILGVYENDQLSPQPHLRSRNSPAGTQPESTSRSPGSVSRYPHLSMSTSVDLMTALTASPTLRFI